MKTALKSVLKSLGLLDLLHYSWLREYYYRLVHPNVIRKRVKQEQFYRNVLQGLTTGAIIYDIGASRGVKTEVFLRLGARVVAVEPNRVAVEHMRRLFKTDVQIIQKAVSDRLGREFYHIHTNESGLNTLSSKWLEVLGDTQRTRFAQPITFSEGYEIETTTLDALIAELGKPFYIKIDVEGYELNTLKGLSQAVDYLSFELNLPEFRQEGIACVERLVQLDPSYSFNYVVDLDSGLERWMDARQCMEFLEATDLRYMEVFCSLKRGELGKA